MLSGVMQSHLVELDLRNVLHELKTSGLAYYLHVLLTLTILD